jgi:hypothetical protein
VNIACGKLVEFSHDISLICKNSVLAAQKTYCVSITKNSWLTLFMEIPVAAFFFCESYETHIYGYNVCKMLSSLAI